MFCLYNINNFGTHFTCWFIVYLSVFVNVSYTSAIWWFIKIHDILSQTIPSITVEILDSFSFVLLSPIFLKGDEKSGLFGAIKPGSSLSCRIQKSTVSRESSNGSSETVLGTKGLDEVCMLFVPSLQTVSVEINLDLWSSDCDIKPIFFSLFLSSLFFVAQ